MPPCREDQDEFGILHHHADCRGVAGCWRPLHHRGGLGRGGRASLWAATGCTLGIVPHILAAITGLAAILHASALAFEIIKYAGVAYLLWMAWSTLRETGTLSVEAECAPKSVRKVIAEAVIINILNPKLSI